MAKRNIRTFVLDRLAKGERAEDVWRVAQAEFPHSIVAWSYVLQLQREFLKGDQ